MVAGVLQIGEPHPKSPALTNPEIRQLGRAVGRRWPGQQDVIVAVFARWPWIAEEDEGKGEGGYFTPAKQEESYGHQLRSVSTARRYYGWRSLVVSSKSFKDDPVASVGYVLGDYGGHRPIRCVAVRPWS